MFAWQGILLGATMSENLQTMDAVFWLTVIFAGLLWALWRAHTRNCEETLPMVAKPSAADPGAPGLPRGQKCWLNS